MATIHVNRGGTTLGTFSEQDVREGLRTGRLQSTDLGWREGMANWQPLSQFSEFADVQPTSAAPPPPPPTTPPVTSVVTTPPPVGSASATLVTPRSGLPWDERQTRGFFNAFIQTLTMVLSKPAEAFTAMKREGGLGDPLIYAIVGGSFGLAVYFVYNFFFSSLGGMIGNRDNPFTHIIGSGIWSLFLIIFVPVFVAIGAFLSAAILHICLMIVGGAKQSFETTFRVVCFSAGSIHPLLVIPFCGALVASVWKIVLYCIGLARAHETDTGRAVLAVILPVVVCCGGGLVLAMMFGALGAWGLSQH